MKIKGAFEVKQKTFRIEYIDDEGEEDKFEIPFNYSDDKKKWYCKLSGDFEQEELDILKEITIKLNKMKFDTISIEKIKEEEKKQ